MKDLAQDLPRAVDPAAWMPEDLSRSESWRHTFTGREIAELLAVVREGPSADTTQHPPLPLLAPEMEKTALELKSGLGFRILRGLPVRELGKQGNPTAFMALSRQLGLPMEQPGGVKLAHVRQDPDSQKRFGFRATGELPFHADLEDVIGFLCIRPASKGGTRKFASAATVHNVMQEQYPDQLRVLAQPFHMALQHPHPDHGRPWTQLPFLSVQDHRFNACAYRVHIKQAQKLPGVPQLTPAQSQAMDAFNTVADKVAVSVDLKPGDVEYFNNHVVLHTRTRFSDDHQGLGRHLLRVWLSMTDFRTLHPEHPIRLRDRVQTARSSGG